MKPANVWAPELKARFSTSRPGGNRFTLIELLVVVAIISILAAMLLPGLQKAKALSMGTTCRSNMKQMQAGLAMYADENDDYFPPVYAHYKGSDATYGVNFVWNGTVNTNEQYVPWHSSAIAGKYFGQQNPLAGNPYPSALKITTPTAYCPTAYKWNPSSPQVWGYIGYSYCSFPYSNYTTVVEVKTEANGGYSFISARKWFRVSNARNADLVFTLVDTYNGYQWTTYTIGSSSNTGGWMPRHVAKANVSFLDGHADVTADLNADKNQKRLTNVMN